MKPLLDNDLCPWRVYVRFAVGLLRSDENLSILRSDTVAAACCAGVDVVITDVACWRVLDEATIR